MRARSLRCACLLAEAERVHCFAPLSRSAAAAAAVHNAWANASYFVRQQSNGGGSRGGSRGGWRGGNAEQRSGAEPRESRGPPRAPAASSADANFTLEGLIGGDSDEEAQRAGRSALGDDVVLSPGVEVHDLDKEVDPDIRSARDELRAALESEARSARAAAEAAAARGAMPAIVDRFGEALPLNSDDERHLPFLPADHLDEASQRRAAQRLRYHSRAVRSTYDSDELEMYALALEREFGSDLELSDVEEEGLRATDYPLGRDPLLDAKTPLPFNVNALAFKTHMNWSGPPGSDQLDRRAVLSCYVRDLKLDAAVAQYARWIANSHYNKRTDALRISVDKHTDAALNKRTALEQLVELVNTARQLAATHGPFKQHKIFPRYSY